MLYQVAICDDEPAFRREMDGMVRRIVAEHGLSADAAAYASCDALLRDIRAGKQFHLLLLDIQMDGLDGMAFARTLRETDRAASIVLVTALADYALEGYEVGALRYLLKPVDPGALERIMLDDYNGRFRAHNVIIRKRGRTLSLPAGEVLWVEARGRKALYRLRDGTVVEAYSPGSFGALADELPAGFVRCHKGYYLNVTHVRTLEGPDALLPNGLRVPVSRTYLADVLRALRV